MDPAHRTIRLPLAALLLAALLLAALLLAAMLAPVPAAASAASASGGWGWPLAPPHRVTRAFLAPASPYAAGHRGVDLEARAGDPVLAPADGVVSFAGRVVDRPVLSIAHAGDLVSTVEPVDALVAVGDRVTAGQTVGVVSAGGHCGEGCLHFGVRLHGRYVSPLLLLGGIPRAVLLPGGASAGRCCRAVLPGGIRHARGWASR